MYIIFVVQSLSCVQLFVILWIATLQAPLSSTLSWTSLRCMSIESVMQSNYLFLCCRFSFYLQSFPASRSLPESALCIRWPKYRSFSFSICPFSEHSGLISFRIDWSDFLTFQGTLKSLFQHHNSKAWVLWHLAFFMVQLSYPYMIPGKIIALAIWTFVGKVMSLLFNTLSRFVIAFLPRSRCLLISWLQSSSAVILEPKKIKSATVFTFSPSVCLEVMGLDLGVFFFFFFLSYLNVEFQASFFTLLFHPQEAF